MCGRFTLRSPADLLREIFGVGPLPGFCPRYNIAPGQPVAAVRGSPREWVELRWGLVPFWADDPAVGSRMINARAETLARRPAFRDAFARRRCLIPADGFYEWQRVAPGLKQPWFLHRRDDRPFAFAGLWESWRPRSDTPPLQTCALITTDANAAVAPIHDRMPVILPPHAFDTWLDPAATGEELAGLLRPAPDDELEAYPVGVWVNDPRHDDPRCLQPDSARRPPRTLFD